MELTPSMLLAGSLQISLLLAGSVLLWRVGLRPAARAAAAVTRRAVEPNWPVPGFALAGWLALVLGGGFLGQIMVFELLPRLVPSLDRTTPFGLLLAGGGFQLGLLAGAWFGMARLGGGAPALIPTAARHWRAGLVTMVVALPVLTAVSWPWKLSLEAMGWPTDQQELVDMLVQADSPAFVLLMLVLAVVVAPVTEELIFRGGLFRFLRTRTPRAVALLLPAALFASLHANLAAFLPLMVLGVIFSLAYERTGSLAVPIVAHALFNLNTIVLVLAGITG
jgi:membrane protease YdiL (CAAX protease family)